MAAVSSKAGRLAPVAIDELNLSESQVARGSYYPGWRRQDPTFESRKMITRQRTDN
jgi:hypothetical protein